jgi:putative endonuclease
MNSYRVYVLRNPKGSSCIGFSEDVDVRVKKHNLGMSRSTRSKGPWKIVWQSDDLALPAARALELELKKQKGGNGFYKKTGLQRF